MRSYIVLYTLIAVVFCRPEADTYDSRYDNFDAHALAENVRLLKAYGHCFLNQGACTAEGNDFKKIIPEALRTSCAKCTPKQRELIRVVVKGFQTKTPDLWEQLVQKEDPEKKYRESFEKFLNASD